MRKAPGSNPGSSIIFYYFYFNKKKDLILLLKLRCNFSPFSFWAISQSALLASGCRRTLPIRIVNHDQARLVGSSILLRKAALARGQVCRKFRKHLAAVQRLFQQLRKYHYARGTQYYRTCRWPVCIRCHWSCQDLRWQGLQSRDQTCHIKVSSLWFVQMRCPINQFI